VAIGKLTNSAIRCVGISLNTSKLSKTERQQVLNQYSAQTGLPCVDPLIEGTGAIVDQLLREFPNETRRA